MKHKVDDLYHLGRKLGWLEAILVLKEPTNDSVGEELSEDVLKDLHGTLDLLRRHCINLEFNTSVALLGDSIKQLPKTHRELELIIIAVSSELKNETFLTIPRERAVYWENPNLISEAIKEYYPKIVKEMTEAGSCYACGLYTASVFHMMRAVEVGLHQVSEALQISNIGVEQQGIIISKIEKAVSDLKELPKGQKKSEQQQFFSEVLIDFRLFKDAYRNYCSHSKVFYTEKQSQKVIKAVFDFFEKISTKNLFDKTTI